MSFPTTEKGLIARMREGDDESWRRFVEKYTGPALGFLGRLGVSQHEAEDLWQEACLQLIEKQLLAYQADKGRFCSWLIFCLRRSRWDLRKRELQEKRGRDVTDSLDELSVPGDPDGPRRVDEMTGVDPDGWERQVRSVSATLEMLLRDYPWKKDSRQREAYFDWFWKGAPPGRRASKVNGFETDEEIARRNEMSVDQLKDLCKRVDAHLQKKWWAEDRGPNDQP